MLEWAEMIVQSSALQWIVFGGALSAFVVKVFLSTDNLLMADLYGDELDD